MNRRFGETYRLHLQGRKWRRYVSPKRRFTQNLQGATSQKTAFFIVTAVKTSNLTGFSMNSFLIECYTVIPGATCFHFFIAGCPGTETFLSDSFELVVRAHSKPDVVTDLYGEFGGHSLDFAN
jgi:hypothetical protein